MSKSRRKQTNIAEMNEQALHEWMQSHESSAAYDRAGRRQGFLFAAMIEKAKAAIDEIDVIFFRHFLSEDDQERFFNSAMSSASSYLAGAEELLHENSDLMHMCMERGITLEEASEAVHQAAFIVIAVEMEFGNESDSD